MRKYDTLKNAPISEAIIDLRVELPPEVGFKTIQRMKADLTSAYPDVKTRKLFLAEFRLGGELEPETDTKSQQDGLVFTSEDKQRVLQATLSGFTFSWLKPYKNWRAFSREAKTLWKIYSAVVDPKRILRIGTRFINRLELPADLRDFNDFLTAVPEIPPRLPQNFVSFFSRIVIPTREAGTMAIITQAVQKPRADEKTVLPVLLDIDVFREGPVEPSSDKVWKNLEKMRDIKNEIFFESITEQLEESYR